LIHELPLEVIAPGDIYEDCAYHPVLCTYISYADDEVMGISLVDGTAPRSCSLRHCGVRKLSLAEAVEMRDERLREMPLPRSAMGSLPRPRD
jgi:hypothetical protein